MRKFKELAELFQELEKTSSNLKMIDILADFLKKISPEEGKITAYLLQGKIAPDYQGLELGLAEKLVIRSLALGLKEDINKIEKLYKETGDLGLVAEKLIKNTKEELTIKEVFEELKKIALSQGKGSQERKLQLLAILIKKSLPIEAKYLIRSVLGTLRLGASDMTFLYALSKVLTGSKEGKKILEHAFNVLSDLGQVAYIALSSGIDKLKNLDPQVGIPVRMMLAQRVKEIKEIKENIKNDVFVEVKYDGERVQAHLGDKEIFLYSRRHENITHQFPDLVSELRKINVKNAILEGEVVAIDKNGNLQPFQILMQRRRKYDIIEYSQKIPIVYFVFDLIYLNGKSLIQEPLDKRKEKLEEILSNKLKESEKIKLAKYEKVKSNDEDRIEKLFIEAIKIGGEGVMIKDSKSIYEAGVRAWRWIKFKKDYKDELVDTFDVVVIGGIYGTGKRAKTYGSLLVALYDPKKNKYYSFTKVGAGFTDEDLENLPKILDKYKIKEKSKLVEAEIDVDVWFEPKVVMEIKGADLTISPVHTVLKDKIKKGGIALRFPRFIRWRDDKDPTQATTIDEVYEIYKRQ
jgi:DNA ligase-1